MPVAFFLDGAAGRLFCTGALHAHSDERRRSVLLIPPFAEEMNKSRHILSGLVRALEQAGHDVLLPDLYGTGDSQGDFGDATLEIWRSDIDTMVERLACADALELVGLRGGALLAADTATRHAVRSLTLLHPLSAGRQQLTQMLRLRLAGGLIGGGEKETAAQLKHRLEQGETLEIAGYRLSGRLASDLESLALVHMPPTDVAQVRWLELVAQPDRPLMPVSQQVIDAWTASGIMVDSSVVACDQFWATQEIAYCPAVVTETMRCFAS